MKRIFLFFFLLPFISFYGFGQTPKEINITCNPADFQYMYENYEQNIYIPITVTYNGISYSDAEMRIRGDGSRVYPKKSLKIKFNDDPFYNGREEVNFSAEYEDHSYIRQAISARIMREAGATCFTTEHVRLFLNGSFFGLYNMIENVDEQFLEARNIDPNGNLYKADDRGACLSIYDDLQNSWEQKTGSGNMEDLVTLINQVHSAPVENYKTFLIDHFDYSHLINMVALNLLTANASTYYHNYYMYHDINGNGKWRMFPWDLDKTCSVYSWNDFTMTSNNCEHDNPLIEKALLSEEVMNDIKNRISALQSDIFTTTHIWPIIDSLANSIINSVTQDTADNIPDLETFATQIQTEKNFFISRYDNLQNQFTHLVSSFIAYATPGINPGNITFRWSPANDPDGTQVKYNLYITTDNCFDPLKTQVYNNLATTDFMVSGLTPGNYFWRVTAIDGDREVDAFDSNIPLIIGQVTQFPCSVETNTTLTAANSPYIVDCNAHIAQNATLTLEPGVEIRIKPGFHILVNGSIQSNGTKSLPVKFNPESIDGSWDSISFSMASNPCTFTNTNFKDGSIHIESSEVNFNDCQFLLENKQLIGQNVLIGHYWGKFSMTNCELKGNNSGQGMEIAYVTSAYVIGSSFIDISDPVEFITINQGMVKNNHIQNSGDDGIDFNNCTNMTVSGNLLVDCEDNGISLGNEFNGATQNILVTENVIINCNNGMTVKDGSVAWVDRNTFAGNKICIKAWQKNTGMGGGVVHSTNNIFYNSINGVLEVDEFSEVDVNYCLANTENLIGTENLFTNPVFVDAVNLNFRLMNTSPCINSGDPASSPDPDGTRADMGAWFFNQGVSNIVINEINYNSSPEIQAEDWVELYNPENMDVNISGWIFKDDDDEHVFQLPGNTIIPSGGFLVLCRDINAFQQVFPDVLPIFGNFTFGLSNSGDMVRLFNEALAIIDSVTFDDAEPWPTEPDGTGPTLELKNPFLNNSIAESWCKSVDNGTPGAINSCYTQSIDENLSTELIQLFPVPCNKYLEVSSTDIEFQYFILLDIMGHELLNIRLRPDQKSNRFNIITESFKPGLYNLLIGSSAKGKDFVISKKFIKY